MNATTLIPLTVGSIFSSSWGYDQTNVNYYQVTKIHPSGVSVTVQEIEAEITPDGGFMTGTSLPVKDKFIRPPMIKRLKISGTVRCFKVASYANAWQMADITKKSSVSWYA